MRCTYVDCDPLVKPSCTHNHHGGIVTDGSCPGCLEYAEVLADDMADYTLDEVLGMDIIVNDQEQYQIMKEGEIEP
jgi:uncharacterized protein (DUF779 family)